MKKTSNKDKKVDYYQSSLKWSVLIIFKWKFIIHIHHRCIGLVCLPFRISYRCILIYGLHLHPWNMLNVICFCSLRISHLQKAKFFSNTSLSASVPPTWTFLLCLCLLWIYDVKPILNYVHFIWENHKMVCLYSYMGFRRYLFEPDMLKNP